MKPRSLLAPVGLLLVGWLFVGQVRQLLADPSIWPPDDFVEYWAAGHLNLAGQDPYSPELLLPLERAAGRDTDEAVMMWNPPWTLTVVMPLGALPARVAQLAWLLVGVAAVGASAHLLWRAYGGSARRAWLAWVLALSFAPTLMVLQAGQIGPLLLLGATLFVWLARRGYGTWAGAAAVLLAIKPHLVYLLWVAVVVDALANRRWAVLLGGAAMGLLTSALPMLFNPEVFAQYFAAMRDHPPAQWVSLTLGTLLRLAFGEQRFGLQFVPVLIGLGWFAWHWRRHGRNWDWGEQLPALVLVSFLTSPYGAWHFDLVLLLLPILHRAARLSALIPLSPWGRGVRGEGKALAVADALTAHPRPLSPTGRGENGQEAPQLAGIVAVYLLAEVAMIALNLAEWPSFWFAWVAPLVAGLYVVAARRPAIAPQPVVALA